MNETNTISLHPNVLRLREENSLLREEVVHLLTEVHDLVHTIKPNLTAIYQTKIGVWELKQFQVQCQAAWLKRKVELIQACLNQNRWPDLAAIDTQLEEEFRAWENKIRLEGERIKVAESRLQHLLSDEDDHEVKRLYYGLVKKLHPDLNPELTEDQKRLWLRVQDAYEMSDIEELRVLAVLANQTALPVSIVGSLERLLSEHCILEQHIHRLLKEIEQTEEQPPLTMRADLLDGDWVRNRRETIQATISELQQRCIGLTSHIANLLKEYPGEKDFGKN